MPLPLCCLGLQAMKDPNPLVRETTAWTIGRVFEFQHDASDANIPELITRETLPAVAEVCCVLLLQAILSCELRHVGKLL